MAWEEVRLGVVMAGEEVGGGEVVMAGEEVGGGRW